MRITWERWHQEYETNPEWRAALMQYHALRRQARINRQLANAVSPGGSNPIYHKIGDHWVKGMTASAKWAKHHKARFRQTFAKQIKNARARLGCYELPKWKPRPAKACDGRIARQYRGTYTTEMSFDERMEDWAHRCAA